MAGPGAALPRHPPTEGRAMSSSRPPGRSQRGQNLVEFALLAPLMFVFLFGIVDFGMALNQRITIQHAVREGARYGAVHVGCEDIQARTQGRAPGAISSADDVGVHYSVQPAAVGDSITVSAPFKYDFPFVGFFHLHAVGQGRVQASARLEMAVLGSEAGGCGP